MKESKAYSLHEFNKAFQKIIKFTESEGLDLTQCAIDVIDGQDTGLHILCHDNVSQRLFGLSLSTDKALSFKWRTKDECDILKNNMEVRK